jgi:hypothetical protein
VSGWAGFYKWVEPYVEVGFHVHIRYSRPSIIWTSIFRTLDYQLSEFPASIDQFFLFISTHTNGRACTYRSQLSDQTAEWYLGLQLPGSVSRLSLAIQQKLEAHFSVVRGNCMDVAFTFFICWSHSYSVNRGSTVKKGLSHIYIHQRFKHVPISYIASDQHAWRIVWGPSQKWYLWPDQSSAAHKWLVWDTLTGQSSGVPYVWYIWPDLSTGNLTNSSFAVRLAFW